MSGRAVDGRGASALVVLLLGWCVLAASCGSGSIGGEGCVGEGCAPQEDSGLLDDRDAGGVRDTGVLLDVGLGGDDGGSNNVFGEKDVDLPDPDAPPTDGDGDGVSTPADCNDANPAVHPGATEVCDGIDNDCDGQRDEGCASNNGGGLGDVGDACAANAECPTGGGCISGWPGGYCSVECGQASPCPSGSTCYGLQTSQGTVPLCLDDCTRRSECRSEYACVPTEVGGACAPACRGDADCNGGSCDATTGLCSAPANNGGTNNGATNNGTNPPAVGDLSQQQITSAGVNRSYLVYVPTSYDGTSAVPLVLAFHGRGDNASNFYQYSQLGSLAEGRGFILAVMQGQNNDWAVHTLPASANPDVSFSLDVVERLSSQFNVDRQRVYAIGYSNGGFFTYLLGMTQANTFGAINIQASGSPLPGQLEPNVARPLPVYIIIGTNDSLLGAARDTRDRLQAGGHPVMYEELPGVGHCCYQYGKNNAIWSFLSTHTAP